MYKKFKIRRNYVSRVSIDNNNNVRVFDILNISVEEYKNSLKNKKYRPTEIDNMNELTLLKLFRDNKDWN